MIDRVPCTFAVSESVDGRVQITIAEGPPGLQISKQGKLSLELRDEFAEAPARYLADVLNKHISSISVSPS